MADSLHYASPGAAQGTTLPRIGGVLGIAGTLIGFGIFVLACFGFGAAFYLSPLPLLLGTVGLILTLVAWPMKNIAVEDSHVVASITLNLAVICGALLEIALMLNQPIFASASGM